MVACSDTSDGLPTETAPYQVERNVVYGMYGGTALLMDVHRPSNPNGRGLIWINGGRWAAADQFGGPPRKDAALPQVFLDVGFTVFPINHRGIPTFTYPAAVEDALRAVRFIRHHAARFGIDPDRIGAVGFSSGGHLASLLGVMDGNGDSDSRDPVERESAKVHAAAVAGGPQGLLGPVHDSRAYPALLTFMGGTPEEMPERYREASPITYVSPDDPPLLMVHGDADRTVPFDQSERMKEALEAVGVPAELVRIPGGDHGASDLSAMVRWMALHLLGEDFAQDMDPVIRAHDRLEEGAMAAYAGDIDTALAAYAEAERVPLVHIPGGHLNALCWNGGRFERAADVIEACDRAVALDPENRFRHDSRGLVRAQLGDLDGAAEDFDFFIETGSAQDARRIQQRRGWLEELRAGRNPFTPEVLRELRGG
jgi:acetyl esterase/lipase